MSSCSVFVFMSLMEFAVVNNYMGPVATKMMKGYSEEPIDPDAQTNGRGSKVHCIHIILHANNLDNVYFGIGADIFFLRYICFLYLFFFFVGVTSANPLSIDRP